MKTRSLLLMFFLLGSAGCKSPHPDISSLKPAAIRTAGNITVVLLNKTGELVQGENEFVVQFKDDQGKPADVGEVQLGSSMSMPSMAPMSGDAQITPSGQTGIYIVKSNFGMSGSWHFTLSWNGPFGQGHTAFNNNVR